MTFWQCKLFNRNIESRGEKLQLRHQDMSQTNQALDWVIDNTVFQNRTYDRLLKIPSKLGVVDIVNIWSIHSIACQLFLLIYHENSA